MDYQNNARQHCCRKTDKTNNNNISTHEVQVEGTRIKTLLTPNSLKWNLIFREFQITLPRCNLDSSSQLSTMKMLCALFQINLLIELCKLKPLKCFCKTGCSKVAIFFIIQMNIQVKVRRQVEHIYTCIYAWVRKYKNKIGKMRGKWDGKERKVMKQQGRVFTIRDVRRPRSCSNTQLLSMGKMMLVLPKQFSIKLGLLWISFSCEINFKGIIYNVCVAFPSLRWTFFMIEKKYHSCEIFKNCLHDVFNALCSSNVF